MKIRNDQKTSLETVRGLQDGASLSRTEGGAAFRTTLNETLDPAAPGGDGPEVGAVPGGGQAGLISQILLRAGGGNADGAGQQDMRQAYDDASGTLDLWESYVRTLSSEDAGSLRNAYALLQDIDAKLTGLKQGAAQVAQEHPGFDDLVNELSVLAATERFKFNRGDYNA